MFYYEEWSLVKIVRGNKEESLLTFCDFPSPTFIWSFCCNNVVSYFDFSAWCSVLKSEVIQNVSHFSSACWASSSYFCAAMTLDATFFMSALFIYWRRYKLLSEESKGIFDLRRKWRLYYLQVWSIYSWCMSGDLIMDSMMNYWKVLTVKERKNIFTIVLSQ